MRHKNIFLYSVTTTLVFFLVVSTYYFSKYQQTRQVVIDQTVKQALHQLAYSEREYSGVRSQFISIVELLSHSRNLYDYILSPTEAHKAVVEEVWSSVATNQKWYTQIRFLNLEGMEKIRLNYVNGENKVYNAAQSLQDKSHRDYFSYAQTLTENQIGAWGIDLENEFGELVRPYQPALRLMTPVYVLGRRAGYLLLNVDVWYLASRLNYSPDRRYRPELLEEHGFYVASDDQSKLFGGIIAGREQHNLSKLFPKSWQQIRSTKSGYSMENGSLLVFNKIDLSPKQNFHLVITFSPKELKELAQRDINDLWQEASLVFLLMLAFVLPATLLLIHYRKRSIESQLARAALGGMSAMIISDRYHRAILVNEQFTKLTGLKQGDIESKNLIKNLLGDEQLERTFEIFEQVSREQLWEGELTISHAEGGEPVTVIGRIQSVLAPTGKVSYYITSIVDISDRKALEEQLRVLSERDSLTQLWNRRKFELELRRQTTLVERYPDMPQACLALLDIDYFKRVNDQLGHDEGDRVIAESARLLEQILRETDFVARIGGEEFAIIMPNTTLAEAVLALERLRIAIELEPSIPITVSIGVTDFSSDSTRSYKCADIALYDSKSHGRNRVSVCASNEDLA